MPAAQTIDEETALAVQWAGETRDFAQASEDEATQAWNEARPVDVTEEAWAARWDEFAADAIRAAADASGAHSSAERSLEEIESSGDDDGPSGAESEEYGWDGSPASSDEAWEGWGDVASDFQQVASAWEDVECLWSTLKARVHAGEFDPGAVGAA